MKSLNGIDKKVKEATSTEIVLLAVKNIFMDYTFLMEDDTYIHSEFQTTNKGVIDLRRVRAYEALLSFRISEDVITYAVYYGDIKEPLIGYESGINAYKIMSISMVNKDLDKIFNDIIDKIKSEQEISKQDIIELTFTLIMLGILTKGKKILNSIRIVKNVDRRYRYDIESILYAFASKFLESKDLGMVKEELKLTELGKGLEDEEKKEKAIETAKIAIKKGMDNETISELTGLSVGDIDLISEVLK